MPPKEDSPRYSGGCLCGQVRYQVDAAPLNTEYCHCSMCRRASGAPVLGFASFPASALVWLAGAPREYVSSPGAWRGFCPNCGGALTFRSTEGPARIAITLGSLDDPASLPPRQHIFEADRIAWLNIADSLPRYAADTPPQSG